MNHSTIRAVILPSVIQLIMDAFSLKEADALDAFYRSATGSAFSDDETGLYGQSPNYIFGLYAQEKTQQDDKMGVSF